MNSIQIKNKTIVLYVPGLGSDASYFDKHIEKLINKAGDKLYDYENVIDMTYYDGESNKYEFSLSQEESEKKIQFSKIISDLVEFVNENPEKVVLVRTYLEDSYDYENNKMVTYVSINNQCKKLVNLINGIKSIDNDIKIKLIGHSLGGLVNLKTAVTIPDKIEEIFSISTPYSAVYFAKILSIIYLPQEFLNEILNKIKVNSKLDYMKDILEKINVEDGEVKNYMDIVATLKNQSFFNSLKRKWGNLDKRPKLSVISGVSAHFMTTTPILFLEVNKRYPFDGIVFGSEQVDIKADNKYILGNGAINCYRESNEYTTSCHNYFGIIEHHNCKHALPCFDVGDIFVKLTLNEVFKYGDTDFLQSIFEGVKGFKLTNPEYKQYYEIFNSQFSHKNIQDADETIDLILANLI